MKAHAVFAVLKAGGWGVVFLGVFEGDMALVFFGITTVLICQGVPND